MIEIQRKNKTVVTETEITEVNKSLDEILTIGQKEGFAYLPKKWTSKQYEQMTVGTEGKIPLRSLNGHANGTPIRTSDGFIVKVGKPALNSLQFD